MMIKNVISFNEEQNSYSVFGFEELVDTVYYGRNKHSVYLAPMKHMFPKSVEHISAFTMQHKEIFLTDRNNVMFHQFLRPLFYSKDILFVQLSNDGLYTAIIEIRFI